MSQDVVDVIMADHREVERLFAELRDPERRAGLVPVLTALLTAHSRAEESEVYPAAREEAGLGDDVAHSQAEHVQADEILGELATAAPESAAFDDLLAQVVEVVTHHVEEEESTVLPGMRQNLSMQRRAELAAAFLAARSEHLGGRPTDIRKQDLQQQAANMGLPSSGSASKEQLIQDLREKADAEE